MKTIKRAHSKKSRPILLSFRNFVIAGVVVLLAGVAYLNSVPAQNEINLVASQEGGGNSTKLGKSAVVRGGNVSVPKDPPKTNPFAGVTAGAGATSADGSSSTKTQKNPDGTSTTITRKTTDSGTTTTTTLKDSKGNVILTTNIGTQTSETGQKNILVTTNNRKTGDNTVVKSNGEDKPIVSQFKTSPDPAFAQGKEFCRGGNCTPAEDQSGTTFDCQNGVCTEKESSLANSAARDEVEPSKSQDQNNCEAKGYKWINVDGGRGGKDTCVDPKSTQCGDYGTNINGKCYYVGETIPNSSSVICDWTLSENTTGRNWAFASNNCPQKNKANAPGTFIPKTKGDCSGNAGWWSGSECIVPSSTNAIPGTGGSLFVCKGVTAGGKTPKYGYAYVSTAADCPWIQEERKAACKDVFDQTTLECRKRTPDEQAALCKSSKQGYDPVTGKCIPPNSMSAVSADPAPVVPKDERDDGATNTTPLGTGEAGAGVKQNCSLWDSFRGRCNDQEKNQKPREDNTPVLPRDERDDVATAPNSLGTGEVGAGTKETCSFWDGLLGRCSTQEDKQRKENTTGSGRDEQGLDSTLEAEAGSGQVPTPPKSCRVSFFCGESEKCSGSILNPGICVREFEPGQPKSDLENQAVDTKQEKPSNIRSSSSLINDAPEDNWIQNIQNTVTQTIDRLKTIFGGARSSNKKDELKEKLELFHGDDGYDYVNQEGLPYSYRLGYGHSFEAVSQFNKDSDCSQYGNKSCEGNMGYAHGEEPGSPVDGFEVKPDPSHPEAWLYYPVTPPADAPTSEGHVE